MLSILNRGADFGFQDSSHNLRESQQKLDELMGSFAEQSSDWKSLSSMFIAGAAGRVLNAALPTFGRSLFATSASRLFSQTLSVAGESVVFESAQRLLSHTALEGNFLEVCGNHFINFSTLRMLAPLGARTNPLLQLGLESGGMVLGQNLASIFSGTLSKNSLAEQFVEASVFALQNRLSFAALHAISGGKLQRWEHALDLKTKILRSAREVSPEASSKLPRENNLLFRMAASDSVGDREATKAKYREHQRGLLERVPGIDFSYEMHDLRVNITEEELGHVIRWKEKGLFLTVSVLIRDAEGRILVTYDRKGKKGIPRIPSGGSEFQDQSLEEVAVREMGEELGAPIEVVRRMAWYQSLMFYNGIPVTPWHTTILEARLREKIRLPQEGELSGVEWVDPSQAVHFSMEGFFPQFYRHVNATLQSYLQRYPMQLGGLPWSDSASIASLLETHPGDLEQRSRNRE